MSALSEAKKAVKGYLIEHGQGFEKIAGKSVNSPFSGKAHVFVYVWEWDGGDFDALRAFGREHGCIVSLSTKRAHVMDSSRPGMVFVKGE